MIALETTVATAVATITRRSVKLGDAGEIAAEPAWIEELVLALPQGRQLASAQDLSVRNLGGEAFISLPQAPELDTTTAR